jgi:DNA polymerase
MTVSASSSSVTNTPTRNVPSPPKPQSLPPAVPADAQPRSKAPVFGPPPAAIGRARDWRERLDALGKEAAACERCALHKTRTHVVFNSGTGEVPLVFVGEAPGADEDAQGEAFVGRAGQLLTRIVAAIGLDRKDVYICNVLKCRPPSNRNPLPDEIETCAPYLFKQLDLLKPHAICTLGLFASQLLLDSKAPIGKLRGRVFKFKNTPLLPTYHPAALLRNPALKRTVWEDVQLLRKLLDQDPAAAAAEPVIEKKALETGPRMGDLFG